jgi:predicted DNA-binding WGR domain protein
LVREVRFMDGKTPKPPPAAVQPDLFGGWTFIREWGRIGRPGTVKTVPCPTEAEALAALERQRRVKERRGYQ